MKHVTFAVLFAALITTSCGRRAYSDAELRSLLTGDWRTSTSFRTAAGDTRIVSQTTGTTTFNADGSLKSESRTLMTITTPEGSVPVDFKAVVHGTWAIDGQALMTTRVSEDVTGSDEMSAKFITSEGVMKMRAESPTQFVYRFKGISPTRIVTADEQGFRTTYTR